jgi:SAM-dependent methyltransferase
VVEAARLLGDGGVPLALRFACAEIADARGTSWGLLGPAEVRVALAPWRDPGAEQQLGAVHEALLTGRKESGSFYTPDLLVEHLLEETLVPLLSPGERVRVLDPACGTGAFLVPAARRIARVTGLPLTDAIACVHGVDLDPGAVEIARFLLWLEDTSVSRAVLDANLVVGDGLALDAEASYDVVVGNPPFLNQLRTATVRDSSVEGVGPYTDTSAVFLLRSAGLVRDGGRVGLVQPLSVLAARDAAPVREALDRQGGLVSLWASDRPVFDGTPVLTCAPVWERGRTGSGAEWSTWAAPSFGIPRVSLSTDHGVLGDLGPCTADFRDQYYGLVPFVREAMSGAVGPGEAALVTTGLIEPAECRWGRTPTRFAKQRYVAPVVDLDALRADGALASWAGSRLVPKVLVATQGAVLEGVVDVDGAWLPSVPTLVCTPPPDRLWHVLAVLLAPPVVALAAASYLGTGLSARSVKLSAKQLAALPLPADRAAWDRGAELARAAQEADRAERRDELLVRCAAEMSAAYAGDHAAVLDWWKLRAGLSDP